MSLTRSGKRAVTARREHIQRPRTEQVTVTVSVELACVLNAIQRERNAGRAECVTIRLCDLTVEPKP